MSDERPIVLTKSQQAQTLANYLPGGRIFASKDFTTSELRKLLFGFSNELLRVDNLLSIFREDTVPDRTQHFIDGWESALGIPDSCFDGKGTDENRRLAIVTKLAALGAQTTDDFVNLAATFGVTVTVESGSVHGTFPYTFPIKFYPSAKVARFTIVVRSPLFILETFPYTFPIMFGPDELGIIECLFNKIKPANVQVVFEEVL